MAADNFGSGIIWTSATGSEEVSVSHKVTETEVGDFYIEVRIKKEVLRLEIAMNNFLEMAVFDAGNNLMEEIPGFVGRKTALRYNVVKSSPPDTYSLTRNISVGVSMTSYRRMM